MDYDTEYEHQMWKEQLPPVLTPADVMEILCVGKNTVYSLLESGKLNGFRIGRNWRITGEALEEFMLLR